MSDSTFEKLNNLLSSNVSNEMTDDPDQLPGIDAAETIKPKVDIRGENVASTRMTASKRSKRRKHKIDSAAIRAQKEAKEARKPRFYCEF